MGWERKRGKLLELGQLLRGESGTSFLPFDGALPETVRYVMTLDSDTRLTRDAVTRLAGKLAHPLNRPVIDMATNTVVAGHTILQPRVTASLTSGSEASLFQRVFSVNRGLDPYVFTISDVYQDLLDEGSFTGKGLYDVEAFSSVLYGRFDDNAILSHDLLEGSLARSALVTDVELVEDFPTRYESEMSPQPWINVVANTSFGFHVSAEGAGYTWSLNSRDHPLTPWSNDPVIDQPGETLHVVDLDSGHCVSPFVDQAGRSDGTFEVRYAPGHVRFVARDVVGLDLELVQFVDAEDPLKVTVLKLSARDGRARRLRIYAVAQWALDNDRVRSASAIIGTRDAASGALYARNPFSIEHGKRVAFLARDRPVSSWSTSRRRAVQAVRRRLYACTRWMASPVATAILAPRLRST